MNNITFISFKIDNFLVALIEDSPSDVPLVKFFQRKQEFYLYLHPTFHSIPY